MEASSLSPSKAQELLNGSALNPPTGVIPNFENPYTFLPVADAVKVVTTVLATLAIFIRIYTKWRIVKQMHLEDYIAVAAWGGYIIFIVTTGFDPDVFGRHQWDIKLQDFQIFLYGTYITSISFGLAILSIKISILLQYIRIFTAGTHDLMFWSCHALMWITIVFYTILLLMTIFICTPIPKFWHVLQTEGKCLDMNYLFIATGSANTISDFLIFLLPQPVIWKLKMSFSEHLGVSMIFSTGLLACIASMIRLFISLKLLKNPDVAWLTSIMCIPSYVELGAGIITSCLPTLPKFFKTMVKIPWVVSLGKRFGVGIEGNAKKGKEKRGSATSIRCSWRKPTSKRKVGRGVKDAEGNTNEELEVHDYGLEEGWETRNAHSNSMIGLGNTTSITRMENGANHDIEIKPVTDEERGILRSVQVSVIRHGLKDENVV